MDGQRWWLEFHDRLPRPVLFETLLAWLAVLSALVFGALLLSARYVARPIRRLADEIARQRAPLAPIAEHGRGSEELRSLAASFNSLVRVAEAGRQTRQNLLAGLSHDLRTPLARLRLRAETQCEPAVADALVADLGSLERIVDQFLAYVQLERAEAVGRAAPLARSVEDVVRRHVEHGDPVEARIAPIDWPVADLAVQRLVGNLVDNALAYGRAPVRVELVEHEGGALLRVLDHGHGMSAAEFELARQPFVRLSPARSGQGHCGLGLAIAAEIVRQWGGELRLAPAGATTGIEATIPRR
ncbi:histidine kinase [Rubrivivax benzoatilyticus JA2 = ATCC BAA-35]|nr:histidine kinase [Rubrivivax benzoatilyticus JA2 = ATCC BAA-35]